MRVALRSIVAAFLLLGGCDPGADTAKEPIWGKQPCEHCAMLLSEKGHGAQLVTQQGERLYFDDLGCMIAWNLEHPDAEAGSWVRTRDTEAWASADKASYERSDRTPMGFGFVAVSGPASLTWSEVREAVTRKLDETKHAAPTAAGAGSD